MQAVNMASGLHHFRTEPRGHGSETPSFLKENDCSILISFSRTPCVMTYVIHPVFVHLKFTAIMQRISIWKDVWNTWQFPFVYTNDIFLPPLQSINFSVTRCGCT
jgi:hypothetical protein